MSEMPSSSTEKPQMAVPAIQEWVKKAKSVRLFARDSARFRSFIVENKRISMLVTDPNDLIQRYHDKGYLFEPEELKCLSKHLDANSIFVDIGCNIGNHSIYAAKVIGVQNIIVFDALPAAIKHFMTNVILNDALDQFDTTWLGYGLGSTSGQTGKLITPKRNMGATKMIKVEGDGVPIISGDEALSKTKVDVIKIDVEGMEMEVLDGLQHTIKENRPKIMIEVDTDNRRVFANWMEKNTYGIGESFAQFRENQNFLIVPMELGLETHALEI